jgi:rod shape-determining protein MreB
MSPRGFYPGASRVRNLRPLFSLFSSDLAIDLGTANTLVYVRGKGEPTGSMIIDIGGGTTDIAVISLSGIVYARSLRMAGNQMDEAIMTYVKRKYNLLIGERTAEQIKIEIGSAFPLDKPLTMEIKGRNLIEGVPKTILLNDSEVREALSEWVSTLMNAIRVGLGVCRE